MARPNFLGRFRRGIQSFLGRLLGERRLARTVALAEQTMRAAAVDQIDQFVRQLGRRYMFEVQLERLERIKLWALHEHNRPFFAVTPQLKQAATIGAMIVVDQAIRAGRLPDIADVEDAIVDAVRAHIVKRFELQGVDVALKPLTPKYLAWKRRHGYDLRIGIQTGKLLRDIKTKPARLQRMWSAT